MLLPLWLYFKEKIISKKKLLDSHQRSWIWGKHAVTEICRAGKWPVIELLLGEEVPDKEKEDMQTLVSPETEVDIKPSKRLAQLCHSENHQGYLAKMGEFPYEDFNKMTVSAGPHTSSAFMILDRIQDPYNMGAVIRSAEVLGMNGIIIPDAQQCGVNSMVARTSAGAVNRIPIARVDDLRKAVAVLKENGINTAGASVKEGIPVYEYDFTRSTAVVLGNEAQGISPEIRNMCDAFIHIPQKGTIDSLNVAQAAAIICYEALRQSKV